jgi:hypothetical protein
MKRHIKVVGFDNYPDRRALQQKYGQNYKAYLSELIPHKHGPGKTTLELTVEMTMEQFLNYLLSLPTSSPEQDNG